MKEGSFENLSSPMSGLDFVNEPTPDQLPRPLEFKGVPENVMRSAVIESLMAQNDDLMARLNVTLRRVQNLEEKLHESQTESNQYKLKYDNLNDQLLVLKEQSRILAERAREAQARTAREDNLIEDLKEQIRVLEIRYSELYATTSERISRLQEEADAGNARLTRHQKYRRKVRAAAVKIREKLLDETARLRSRVEHQESQIHDLRTNLQESTDYISTQGKNFNQERQQIVEAYEKELTNLQQMITAHREAQENLQKRIKDYQALYDEKVRIENELIIERRRSEDREIESTKEIADLQKTVARFRNESKEMALEASTLTERANEATAKAAAMTEENAALTEQVENLQILWRDQQAKIEKLTEQKVALQKLNQELSQNLNQYRRDVRELKDQLDRLAHNQKPAGGGQGSNADDVTPQIIEKIDKVLAELHSGKA